MTRNKIIVGYDRSPEARLAAAWALDEAARTGAVVELLYAYEWPVWAPAASMVPAPAVWPDGETERARRAMLDDAVAAARRTHPGVLTRAVTVTAPAALTLRDRSTHAALVVVGSQGHSGVAGLLGSVSAALSAHAHCPVLVIRGRPAPDAPIVVGVDDSETAQLALAFAVEQAVARAVPLRVIHARPATAGAHEAPASVPERLEEMLAPWRNKHPDLAVTTHVVAEHPAAALTRESATAQLVVAGCRGRGAFRGMLLGSVSQHLLHHAACPVAIVRELPAT